MNYRSDIDGLRALAVILVICFHFQIYPFVSGFIGVDIFFVISGFLISSIIYTAMEKKSFSLASFYSRRLWRLQPSLLVVIVLCLIIGALIYLPDDFSSLTKSIKYTLLISSNKFFSKETTAYAAPDSILFPLLHTWTLSIEWQWYVILPLTCVLIFKFISKKHHFPLSILFTLASLLLIFTFGKENESYRYYSLALRVFEFMIGVTAGFVVRTGKTAQVNSHTASIVTAIAIIAIVGLGISKDVINGYPNYLAIIVCLLTATIICLGESKNFAAGFLSIKPMNYIGKISYSLYLYHLPVISFGVYLSVGNSPAIKTFQLLLVCILSIISYHLIEKPFRRCKLSPTASIALLAAAPAILGTLVYSMSIKNDGWPARLGTEYAHIHETLKTSTPDLRLNCFNWKKEGMENTCKLGEIGAKEKALLIGDSNSNHFWRFFDVLAKDAKIEVTALSSSSCLALPGILQIKQTSDHEINNTCKRNVAYYYDLIKNNEYKYVILGEAWGNYENKLLSDKGDEHLTQRALLERSLIQAIGQIKESGAQPVLVKEIARMPGDYMACFYSKFKPQFTGNTGERDCSFKINHNRQWFDTAFDSASKQGVKFVYPREAQCTTDNCSGSLNGMPIYRDIGHLTDYAAYHYGKDYLKIHSNPLKDSRDNQSIN